MQEVILELHATISAVSGYYEVLPDELHSFQFSKTLPTHSFATP